MCAQTEVTKANAEGERALAGGDLARAEQAFTAALDSLGEYGQEFSEVAAVAYLGLGRVCLTRNDFRGADLRFDHVQRLLPSKPEGYYWGGCVAAHHASFHRAEWLFGAALERDAQLGTAYLQRAFVRLKRRQEDLALTDLLAAARCQAIDDDARLLTAVLLLRNGDWSGAESLAAEVDPDRPEAAAILGVARHRQGEVETAFARYEHALAAGLRDDALLLQHGLAAYQLGRFTASLGSWQALRDRYPHHTALNALVSTAHAAERLSRGEVQAAVAAVRIRDGDWSAALDVLHGLPDVPWRLTVYAEALYRTGRHDELHMLPRNAWQDVALARSRPADAANNPTHHERARRELALVLSDASLAAAQQGDWRTAASLLRRRDSVVAGEPDLVEALIYGLGGFRSEAIERLGRLCARGPTDHRVSHVQALLQLHTLSAGTTSPPRHGTWLNCIGAWISVLYSEDFWEQWPRRAQDRYGRTVPTAAVQSVRATLRELIEQRLPTNDTTLLLRREHEAARVLGQLGGLPTEETRLVCGPLRIAELGLQRQLSEFLLQDPDTSADLDGMLRQFSQLGLAEAHLAASRPREATRIALDQRCPSCRQAAGNTYPAVISEPLLCEPDCPEFDLRNPSFSAFAEKHDALSRSSAELAAQTLLGIARSDITGTDMDLADARRCWREAVTLAKAFGRRDYILRVAVDDALGRAKGLVRKRNVTNAIAVLDAVRIVIPSRDTAERNRVTHVLADLLNVRGVQTFRTNRRDTYSDLSRAVTLSPDLRMPRLNLGVLLRAMAYDALDDMEIAEGVRLLGSAIAQFEQGLETWPGDSDFGKELDRTRTDLDTVLGKHDGPPRREGRG